MKYGPHQSPHGIPPAQRGDEDRHLSTDDVPLVQRPLVLRSIERERRQVVEAAPVYGLLVVGLPTPVVPRDLVRRKGKRTVTAPQPRSPHSGQT